MDPLTAVGLASSVLSFIDFGSKILKQGIDTYKGHEARETHDLKMVIENLEQRLKQIAQNHAQLNLPNSPARPHSSFILILNQCRQIGNELQAVLQGFQVDSDGNKFERLAKGIGKAIKAMISKGKVDELVCSLERLRNQLSFSLAMTICHDTSTLLQNQQDYKERLGEVFQVIETFRQDAACDIPGLSNLSSLVDDNIRQCGIVFHEITTDIKRLRQENYDARMEARDYLAQNFSAILSAIENSNSKTPNVDTHDPESENLSWSEKLLKTFRFPTIDDREEVIEEAHQDTFKWIIEGCSKEFMDKLSSRNPEARVGTNEDPCKLRQWLQSGEGIFRICGKPGCGKSTLMKMLASHPDCNTLLKGWRGDAKLYKVKFFAFKGANTLEHTLKGFLQSLVHQILTQDPEIRDHIIKDSEQRDKVALWKNSSHDSKPHVHSFPDLKKYWNRFQKLEGRKLFIILDGLDEFTGNQHELASFVRDMAELKSDKILIAARDEQCYTDCFGRDVVMLHELTRPDIEIMSRKTFDQSPAAQTCATAEPEAFEELITDLLDAADGVFIWVKIVIASLLEGFTKGKRVQELRQELRKLPPVIDELYKRILDRLDPDDHYEAVQIFRYCHISHQALGHPVSLRGLTLFQQYDREDPLWIVKLASIGKKSRKAQVERTMRRLKNCCSYFLTIGSNGDTIEYLHKTAHDFLTNNFLEISGPPLCQSVQQGVLTALAMSALVPTERAQGVFTLSGERNEFCRIYQRRYKLLSGDTDARKQIESYLSSWGGRMLRCTKTSDGSEMPDRLFPNDSLHFIQSLFIETACTDFDGNLAMLCMEIFFTDAERCWEILHDIQPWLDSNERLHLLTSSFFLHRQYYHDTRPKCTVLGDTLLSDLLVSSEPGVISAKMKFALFHRGLQLLRWLGQDMWHLQETIGTSEALVFDSLIKNMYFLILDRVPPVAFCDPFKTDAKHPRESSVHILLRHFARCSVVYTRSNQGDIDRTHPLKPGHGELDVEKLHEMGLYGTCASLKEMIIALLREEVDVDCDPTDTRRYPSSYHLALPISLSGKGLGIAAIVRRESLGFPRKLSIKPYEEAVEELTSFLKDKIHSGKFPNPAGDYLLWYTEEFEPSANLETALPNDDEANWLAYEGYVILF